MAWDRLSQGADLQEWLTNEIAIHDLIQKDRARRALFGQRMADRKAYDAALQAMTPEELADYKRWESIWQSVTGEYLPEVVSGHAQQIAYGGERQILPCYGEKAGQQTLIMGENFGLTPDSPYWGMRYHGMLRTGEGELLLVVSFLYHKYQGDGTFETKERVVAITGFAYGKHKDHMHQPDGLFMVGIDIGRYTPPAAGRPASLELAQPEVTAQGEIKPMAVKYFSVDCIDRRPTWPDAPMPIIANPSGNQG